MILSLIDQIFFLKVVLDIYNLEVEFLVNNLIGCFFYLEEKRKTLYYKGIYFEHVDWDNGNLICDIEGGWYTDDDDDVVMDVCYHNNDEY